MGLFDELGSKLTDLENKVTDKALDAESKKVGGPAPADAPKGPAPDGAPEGPAPADAPAQPAGEAPAQPAGEAPAQPVADPVQQAVDKAVETAHEGVKKVVCSKCGVTIAGPFTNCPNCGAPLN